MLENINLRYVGDNHSNGKKQKGTKELLKLDIKKKKKKKKKK